MEKKASIIIPAYNEAEGIAEVLEEVLREFRKSDWEGEVIVVDDGSTDGTPEIVREMEGVRLIRHETNMGYGAALKTGIRNASHDLILMMDADGTYPAREISRILEHALGYDMVVGARTGKNVEIPLLRRPAKFLISMLANYLTGVRIPDVNSGMRAFKKEVATRFFNILPNAFSFTVTITLACLTNNLSVKYVPIDYRRRKGRSTIHPIKDTMNFLLLVVRTVMYFRPLKVFLPAGVLILLVGLGKLVFIDIMVKHNITDLSVVLLLGGIQICFFGLLADLIVKRL